MLPFLNFCILPTSIQNFGLVYVKKSKVLVVSIQTLPYSLLYFFEKSLRVTVGHPRVTIGHLRVTIGHIRVTICYLKATVVHIRVKLGHLRVTLGHLRVTIDNFSISKHKANTTELHPKVRQTCFYSKFGYLSLPTGGELFLPYVCL